jgi:iron complex transport system substrate-binding protein
VYRENGGLKGVDNKLRFKKHIAFTLLCLWGCFLLAAGCGEGGSHLESGGKPGNESVTITDSAGRSVVVPQPLERAVVLYTGMAEAVNIIKAQDKVVGVDMSVQTHPYLGMQNKVSVGESTQPNYERSAELRPQAVVVPASIGPIPVQEITEKLEPAGIRVVLLDIHKPETSEDALKILAKIFAKEKEAAEFLKWKAAQIAILDKVNSLQAEQKTSVFTTTTTNFELEKWNTSGTGLAAHQTIELAGGINAARELQGSVSVSPEWILEQNPGALVFNDRADNIVGFTVKDFEKAEQFKAKVEAHSIFSNTAAAQESRICIIDNSIFSGDKSFLGALYLAKWLYPDQFRDVDPNAALQEYFERWVGITFQGLWIYPSTSE